MLAEGRIWQMQLDASLWLGVAGVALTVIFFVIGYRQTVGARKERATSANKSAVSSFFRRLTLEDTFQIGSADIERFLTGVALDANVRRGDLFSIEEFRSLIVSRVIDSDYINDSVRNSVLKKIASCFDDKKISQISSDSEHKRSIPVEFQLAIFALISAGVVTVTTASIFTDSISELIIWPFNDVSNPVAFVPILIVGTAAALATYSFIRDRSSGSGPSQATAGSSVGGLSSLMRGLSIFNPELTFDMNYKGADLLILHDKRRYILELKADLNRTPSAMIKSIVNRLTALAKRDSIDKVFLVSVAPPRDRAKGHSSDIVSVVSIADLLQMLKLK